jgi:hypothetical protein
MHLVTTAGWPDTTSEPPPSDHLYRSATWLLGRHPQLADLVARVPGVIGRDEFGRGLAIDLVALGEAVNDYDDHDEAWAEYGQSGSCPF